MKIKVHEIDGDYYCAIDDIALVLATTGAIKNKKECLITLIQDVPVFFIFKEDGRHHFCTGNDNYKKLKTGLYQVTRWGYSYFSAGSRSPKATPKVNVERLKKKGDSSDYDIVFIGWEINYGEPFRNANYTIESVSDCYVKAIDADIYLKNHIVNQPRKKPLAATVPQIDIPPTTPKIEPTTEQATTETQSILNDQGDYFSPYLAIAIDIWERAYVHGEAKETSNKLGPIIKLIEKHYPQIESDTVKKQIADIIVTKRGTPLDKVEAKPRQSK